MKKLMAVILCGLLLLAMPLFAAPQSSIAAASSVQAANPSPDISTDLKLQQQKLEFFKERLDLQDKRIGDLSFYLSLSLACFGVLMTVIVVFFSLRSTKEAVLAAKDEARNEVEAQAKVIIESWLGKEGQQLLVQKVEDTLRPEINKALDEIRNVADGVIGDLEKERRRANDHNAVQESLNERHKKLIDELSAHAVSKDRPLSKEQRETVDEAAKELESKPPNEYRFEDWFMLGLHAFESAKYEIAAENFAKAAEVDSHPIRQAMARVNRGGALVLMRHWDEAIAVYDEVVRRYADAEDASLHESVARALNGIGFNLLCKAKEIWKEGDESAAKELLVQAQEKVEASLQLDPDEPVTLGNQGYVLFLLGRSEEARPILVHAIALGGEDIRQAELSDTDIHPLPQDEEFRALIKSL